MPNINTVKTFSSNSLLDTGPLWAWSHVLYMQTKHIHGPLGCWIGFQFLMHTEDCRSLLNTVSLPPNKYAFIIVISGLVWKSFIRQLLKVLLSWDCGPLREHLSAIYKALGSIPIPQGSGENRQTVPLLWMPQRYSGSSGNRQ